MFTLYEESVGRNCTLLLNVPPDRRGLIADPDLAALSDMRRRLDATYGHDRAAGAARQDQSRVTTLALPAPAEFDRVVVQEDLAGGQSIAGFVVEAWTDGSWRRIATGSTVGYKRIVPVPLTRASAVRIRILDAHGEPRIARMSLHATAG